MFYVFDYENILVMICIWLTSSQMNSGLNLFIMKDDWYLL